MTIEKALSYLVSLLLTPLSALPVSMTLSRSVGDIVLTSWWTIAPP